MRLSPRISTAISAFAHQASARHTTVISNLGTGGMFLQYRSAMQVREGEVLSLRYRLSLSTLMKHCVKVLRKDGAGCAVSLMDGEGAAREAIWNYVAKALSGSRLGTCPFCGARAGEKDRTCPRCLCSLEFGNPGYFDYLETMSLFRRLEADADRLQPAQMQGLALFGLASFFAETIEAYEH